MNLDAPAIVKTNRTIAVILGGGAGTRLFPLTKDRAKPAVPLAGKYRLVDIPISNCINSNIKRIFLLTQFESASLHRHIQRTYKFDEFSGGFVEIMAAQQSVRSATGWYQGTADAVRQNIVHFDNEQHDYVAILSGDQLYRMDYRLMLAQHQKLQSHITVAVIPVDRESARSFGIMRIDEQQRITRFVEKPSDDATLDELKLDSATLQKLGKRGDEDLYLASMGIYIFGRLTLRETLDNELTDFGKHVIPNSIANYRVHAHVFEGYWEDLGTIKAYYQANLDETNPSPRFRYFDPLAQIYTRPRNLPPNKLGNVNFERVAMCSGCRIGDHVTIHRSLIGNRAVIANGVVMKDTVMMGADYFEEEFEKRPAIPIGIGEGCKVERAIIDKNVRIGKNCVISPDKHPAHFDHSLFYIREGILVIPKNTMIPDNSIL